MSSTSTGKKCFVISPIGAPNSDTRRRADKILNHVIREVVEPMGYVATRSDDIDASGLITTQIIHRIATDELVVADLTEVNPNVFYELALRHALKKPFIQIAEEGQSLPFDVQGLRTIFFDHTDLDSVANAKNRMRSMIEAIEQGGEVETPITFAVRLHDLRDSSDPGERGIAEVLESIQRLERSIHSSQQELSEATARRSAEIEILRKDALALRKFVEGLTKSGAVGEADLIFSLDTSGTSAEFRRWVDKLEQMIPRKPAPKYDEEPPF